MSETQTTVATINLLTITSVPAETVDSGKMQIVASWKTTKEKIVPAANKNRAIILPADYWTNGTEIGNIADKSLRVFILEAIEKVAKSYLSTISEESNWKRTQVPESHFSFSSLLAWQDEQSALAGRLNGDAIKEWLKTSATMIAFSELHGKEMAGALGDKLVSLAAPVPGITKGNASNILGQFWKEEDSENLIGLKIQTRLTAILNKKDEPKTQLDSII